MNKLILAVAFLLAPVLAKAGVIPTDRVGYSTKTVSGASFGIVVPAQGAGVKIAVNQYEVSCSTNGVGTQIAWGTNDNAPADIISSTITVSNVGLVESPFVPNGFFTTSANQPLVLNVGTAGQSCAANVVWSTIQQ